MTTPKNPSIIPFCQPQIAENVFLAPGGQAQISCPLVIANYGIDTLSLVLDADIPPELIENLSVKKLEVQSGTDDCLFLPFGVTTLFSFNLQRTGRKYYPYVLQTGDFSVSISARKCGASIPVMTVTVGSISCNNDLTSLLKSFRLWCAYYKIRIKSEKVSRVDLFGDFTAPINELNVADQEYQITRAEKMALYFSSRRLSGIQIGCGDIVLRMYDKIREMTDKQALHKAEFFQAIWGNQLHITRVEFQLRRESIKQFLPDNSDYYALLHKAPEIWKYLTSEWFRLTFSPVDRANNHQSRSDVSEFWLVVQSAFEVFEPTPTATRNKKQPTINIEGLIDQAAGILLTVCAASGVIYSDIFGIMTTAATTVQAKLTTLIDQAGFKADFESRFARAFVTF